MKATNVIIIGGGAIALLYFLKNRKVKKISIAKPNVTTTPTTGGARTGGATAGTSQVTSFPIVEPSNEPEQVFGLGLPTGMDLPILTAGNGIPTEVAIQQGGVNTTPKTEAITVSESEENRLRELALSLALEEYRRNINNQQSTPIYDDPYKGQIGGFPQYPPQPIDDIIEPIRFPMPSIIDPISIEVTNPSVFTKKPNYVMPVIQNTYQQEFSNVDRQLFNMNQDIYSI